MGGCPTGSSSCPSPFHNYSKATRPKCRPRTRRDPLKSWSFRARRKPIMSRKAVGSLYYSHGAWFASLSLPKRTSFRLDHILDEAEARTRLALLVDVSDRLRRSGHTDLVQPLLQQVGEASS